MLSPGRERDRLGACRVTGHVLLPTARMTPDGAPCLDGMCPMVIQVLWAAKHKLRVEVNNPHPAIFPPGPVVADPPGNGSIDPPCAFFARS